MADRIKQLEEENRKKDAEITRLRQAEERRMKMKEEVKRKKEEAKIMIYNIKQKYQKL